MAKKGDILVKLYQEFPDYLKAYQTRLNDLEREFLHAKNDYQSYLAEIEDQYRDREDKLTTDYLQIELIHHEKIREIDEEFTERFAMLQRDIAKHNAKTQEAFQEEDDFYQQILNQFEERKAEAFNTYLNLTKETNYMIDREMKVHHEFIDSETEKLNAKKLSYQDLNSNLSNQLIWTMEKAKNALNKLSASLIDEGTRNREFLADVINESLTHLNSSKDAMGALFKTTSAKFEKERNLVRTISQEKRKPHSEINQQMIRTFVKQIREVNENKVAFEAMTKRELELSLSTLYPKIIEADANQNLDELEKLILQKEIIDKKANYLLNRNNTMADLLIAKYQNEIKKIKIDSFKRSEEIKLAYSVPVAFFQNSINVYSNFAFYLNETYEELTLMLNRFKQFNSDYIEYKEHYIHNSQKSFEDYKINLLVKVNNLTNQLTEYISQIDQLSHEIVTLESNNRLEIAEIRKKMENLEVFGDYQKYIASLENDLFFAMFQHNKNMEKIQIDSNYTNNLYDINRDVLMLNQNKLEYQEYQEYMLKLADQEKIIHDLTHDRRKAEAKAVYKQKIDQVLALSKIANERIIYNAKHKNYEYAASYMYYLNDTEDKNNAGSEQIIEFIHHAQNLIDVNTKQTKEIRNYLQDTEQQYAYLRILEQQREELLKQLDQTTEKKNRVCLTACELYEKDIQTSMDEIDRVFHHYLLMLKEQLLKLHSVDISSLSLLEQNGYREELVSAIGFISQHSLELAYKYQVPHAIHSFDNKHQEVLENFVIHNHLSFKKVKHRKNKTKYLKEYYVLAITQFTEYQDYVHKMLQYIVEKATENDKKFIANTIRKADQVKLIINKEYDKLEFKAFRNNNSKKRQLSNLEHYSQRINQIYKTQVTKINNEYLNTVSKDDKIARQMANQFSHIITKNNRELNQMLKFLKQTFAKEQKQLELQYQRFQKSLEHIESVHSTIHEQEIEYVKALYTGKELDASKTISILENKINALPVERDQYTMTVKKEKFQLQMSKGKELQKKLAELEKDKFVSRPKYLQEIDEVKKRLPDDYVDLYNRIQHLEFDYLNQFSKINDEYTENYKEYLLNQSGNNEILETESKLYLPFMDMQVFNEKIIQTTTQTYKDTIAKSKKTRENLNKEAQKSNEKQKRIINV